MTPDDPAAAALQRLEQAMDIANDLIGGLIRRLDDGGRPQLHVVTGSLPAADPHVDDVCPPPLRVLRTSAEH